MVRARFSRSDKCTRTAGRWQLVCHGNPAAAFSPGRKARGKRSLCSPVYPMLSIWDLGNCQLLEEKREISAPLHVRIWCAGSVLMWEAAVLFQQDHPSRCPLGFDCCRLSALPASGSAPSQVLFHREAEIPPPPPPTEGLEAAVLTSPSSLPESELVAGGSHLEAPCQAQHGTFVELLKIKSRCLSCSLLNEQEVCVGRDFALVLW